MVTCKYFYKSNRCKESSHLAYFEAYEHYQPNTNVAKSEGSVDGQAMLMELHLSYLWLYNNQVPTILEYFCLLLLQ